MQYTWQLASPSCLCLYNYFNIPTYNASLEAVAIVLNSVGLFIMPQGVAIHEGYGKASLV